MKEKLPCVKPPEQLACFDNQHLKFYFLPKFEHELFWRMWVMQTAILQLIILGYNYLISCSDGSLYLNLDKSQVIQCTYLLNTFRHE